MTWGSDSDLVQFVQIKDGRIPCFDFPNFPSPFMASPAPNKCSSCTVSCLANKPAGLSQSEADSVLQGFSEAYKLLLTQKEAVLAATDGPSLESALGTLLNELVTISEVFAVTLEI